MEKVKADTSTPPFQFDRSNEKFEIFLIPQELNIKDYKHLSIDQYYLAFLSRALPAPARNGKKL